MRIPLPRRRVRPRTACIALLTLAIAAAVVLPEAGGASGLNTVHRPPTVPTGLDARRAVVIRPHRVDLVDGGTVIASMPYDGANAALGPLATAIGAPHYLVRKGATVVVRAAIVQRPGTRLTVGADGVRIVQIQTAPGATAYVWGTGAALTLDHVAVRGSRTAPSARGYVRYSGASTVTLKDSSLADLGRPGRHPVPALDLGRGTRAVVTGTTFSRVSTGLVAHGSASVTLRQVTVRGATGNGISLVDAGTVDAAGVTVSGNARNGLALTGTATRVRSLRDVTASRNGHAGLIVSRGAAPTVVRLRSDHNGNAGAVLTGAGRTRLVDGTSTAETTGVRVRNGLPATITGLAVTGDATGVSAEGTARGLVVRGSTVRGTKVGLRLRSAGARVERLSVEDGEIGLESGPGAAHLSVTGLTASTTAAGRGEGGETGPAGGTGVVVGGPSSRLSGVQVTGLHTGVRIEGADAVLTDTTVDVAGSGILLTGTATGADLSGVHAAGADEGLRISAGADGAHLVDATVDGEIGLRVGARDVTVTGGSLQARSVAVVVDSGAGDASLSGVQVGGAMEGVRMAASAGNLTLDGVRISGAARSALELDGGTTTVHGSALESGGTVVDAAAELHLEATTVTGPIGVRVADGVTGTLVDSRVDGRDVGVLAVPGSHVTLTGSRIYGAVPVRGSAAVEGHSFVAAMPVNWLGVAGIALVVIAGLLTLAARVRERGHHRVSLAPAHVVNRA